MDVKTDTQKKPWVDGLTIGEVLAANRGAVSNQRRPRISATRLPA